MVCLRLGFLYKTWMGSSGVDSEGIFLLRNLHWVLCRVGN
jgi:hypothetical protein